MSCVGDMSHFLISQEKVHDFRQVLKVIHDNIDESLAMRTAERIKHFYFIRHVVIVTGIESTEELFILESNHLWSAIQLSVQAAENMAGVAQGEGKYIYDVEMLDTSHFQCSGIILSRYGWFLYKSN